MGLLGQVHIVVEDGHRTLLDDEVLDALLLRLGRRAAVEHRLALGDAVVDAGEITLKVYFKLSGDHHIGSDVHPFKACPETQRPSFDVELRNLVWPVGVSDKSGQWKIVAIR